jgi:hypothetical protein
MGIMGKLGADMDDKDLPKPISLEYMMSKGGYPYFASFFSKPGTGISIEAGTFEECLTAVYRCYQKYPANFRAAWVIAKCICDLNTGTEDHLPKSADLTQPAGPYSAYFVRKFATPEVNFIALGSGTYERCLDIIHKCYRDYPLVAPGSVWFINKNDRGGYKD